MPGTLLASVQHANHELGTMQQVGEAARLAREAHVRFHTDACQTVGRLPVDVEALGRRPAVAVGPQVRRTARASARSTCGAASASPRIRAATTASASDGPAWRTHRASRRWRRRSRRRSPPWATARHAVGAHRPPPRAHRGRRCPGARVHGHPTHRTPHLVCFSVEGLDPATLMMALDDRGFRLAAGLPLLRASPRTPRPCWSRSASRARRASASASARRTTEADVDALLEVLPGVVDELREVEAVSSEALARFRAPGSTSGA